MRPSSRFPSHFVWGVAMAAPQVEGASATDGKGESIWDRFASQPGRVAQGHRPDVSADHYHHFDSDFALMRQLGVRHYRLSLAWSRLFPDGAQINARGMDFYRHLLASLHRHGITPWVTLYHWDLPQALEQRGGWRNRATVEAFARYVATAVRAFRGEVRHWITLNEIPTFVGNGYGTGLHAPGARESPAVLNQSFHHAVLAHGHAVAAIREHGGRHARIGLAHDIHTPIPICETPPDIAAAEAVLAQEHARVLAPIFHGRYPESFLRAAGGNRPKIARGDLAMIGQRVDFLGLNIYTGRFVEADASGKPRTLPWPARFPQADLSWLYITPQAIYWALRHCHALYLPAAFYITENGVGYEESGRPGEELPDLNRREYLRNYLQNVHRAVAEGIPCRGFFAWSFLDNFEWAEGYAKRFGLVHVDYATQRRTPKLSARWYQAVMRHNRLL